MPLLRPGSQHLGSLGVSLQTAQLRRYVSVIASNLSFLFPSGLQLGAHRLEIDSNYHLLGQRSRRIRI
eukprot:3058037-Pleurochrysis_carterae.AAC.1